jgi:molybdenum-dependent DNA-binding transcriptional regulator ModE
MNSANPSNEMGVFQRVVERGSFAGAAEDCGLSPSAVSKLITRLEYRLGVRLINRTTRRLALTHEGEIYLERSRDILRAIEATESEIASTRWSPRGHLRVHVFPTFAVDHLAPALPDFLARYPRVTFDFLVTNRLVDLIGDNVDIALRVGPLSDAGGLREPSLPGAPWSAAASFRSHAAFMPDAESLSGCKQVAVSDQRPAGADRSERPCRRRQCAHAGAAWHRGDRDYPLWRQYCCQSHAGRTAGAPPAGLAGNRRLPAMGDHATGPTADSQSQSVPGFFDRAFRSGTVAACAVACLAVLSARCRAACRRAGICADRRPRR